MIVKHRGPTQVARPLSLFSAANRASQQGVCARLDHEATHGRGAEATAALNVKFEPLTAVIVTVTSYTLPLRVMAHTWVAPTTAGISPGQDTSGAVTLVFVD